ncbi:MAG: flavin reductase [Desulfobacteraceae bacterium]
MSRDNDRVNGQIINTAIQVTSEPPRVAVIINKKNLTHELNQ